MEKIGTELLLSAYRQGFFPMGSSDGQKIDWYCPKVRGIIPLDRPYISRRLWRSIRSESYKITSDHAFKEVMEACAAPQEGQEGRQETWISQEIIALYTELYREGYAHSIEIWSQQGRLVGGLYGVSLGAAFFGESMFSFERDTSKIALIHLIALLRQGGYRLLDTQYMTPHLQSLGGVAVSSLHYQELLNEALEKEGLWRQEVTFSALSEEFQKLRELRGKSS